LDAGRRPFRASQVLAAPAAAQVHHVEGTLIRRILLVEDDAGMRDAIRALLERAGFSVAVANDGAEAWELLSRGPRPAAILADLYTPRMTGHDLVARIRRTPRLAAIPVIAMSGERERATRDRPAAQAFLEKPFSREQLEWALDRVGA
jgi:two-component system chemotaxis response regulator CheY